MILLSVMIALRRIHALFVGSVMHVPIRAVSCDASRIIVIKEHVMIVTKVEGEVNVPGMRRASVNVGRD